MRYINTWSQALKLSLITLAVFIAKPGFSAFSESDPLPDLTSFNLVGETPDLKGKVVLIDFWASWCAPCKASFPAMDEMYQEYKDKGFEILAVSVDNSDKAYQKFAEKSGVSFPLVLDKEKKLVSAAEIQVMPTSFMVDKKGIIRSVHNGYQGQKSIDTYREEIENLLKE